MMQTMDPRQRTYLRHLEQQREQERLRADAEKKQKEEEEKNKPAETPKSKKVRFIQEENISEVPAVELATQQSKELVAPLATLEPAPSKIADVTPAETTQSSVPQSPPVLSSVEVKKQDAPIPEVVEKSVSPQQERSPNVARKPSDEGLTAEVEIVGSSPPMNSKQRKKAKYREKRKLKKLAANNSSSQSTSSSESIDVSASKPNPIVEAASLKIQQTVELENLKAEVETAEHLIQEEEKSIAAEAAAITTLQACIW